MRKREYILVACAILAMGALVFAQFFSGSIATGAWGLSFHAEGQAPIGPAGADELAKFDAVYLGSTSDKVI